ncbi:MAG: SAM-dependent methyltransferase [Verrucomicrobiales bacterium]
MKQEPLPTNSLFLSPGTDAAADDLLGALMNHFSGGIPTDEFEPKVLADLRKELGRGELVSADMVQLWRMLTELNAKLPYPPGNDATGTIDLLNLACGHCEEAAVLAAFFGRDDRRVRFFGMDVRDREIETAKRRYQATENAFRKLGVPKLRGDEGEGEAQFIADDATKLDGYREIPREYDLIFLRHQNVWHDRDIWRRIYEFALARLPDHGYLVITSYFDREHLIALDLLKTIGAEVVVSLENPNSRPLDYPGKSVDRHLAALRKFDFKIESQNPSH